MYMSFIFENTLESNCRERCGAIDAEEIREMGKQGQVCVEEHSN